MVKRSPSGKRATVVTRGITQQHTHSPTGDFSHGFPRRRDTRSGGRTILSSWRKTNLSKTVSLHGPSQRSFSLGRCLALVGWVFLSEGIQKFLFPAALGIGRFARIGIPAPQVMAPFVGVVEIGCGVLILIGLFTRWATVPLLIDIAVALLTTKLPMLAKDGLWSALHEARAT